MSDSTRDYSELRREVLEGRNQAIKTDNQLKNLILDIKHFEKRFDSLEKRVRTAGIGVNLIIAATLALTSFAIITIRAQSVAEELAGLRRQASEAQSVGQAQVKDLERRLTQKEAAQTRRDTAAQTVGRILDLLEAHQEREAGLLLATLDMSALSDLERRTAQTRLAGLRQRQAEAAYRAGRLAMTQGRLDEAVMELRRALLVDAEGRLSGQARYQLATSLYALRKYAEAAPIYREISTHEIRAIAEEGTFFAGASEVRAGRLVEGRTILAQVAQTEGRYAASARLYVAAIDQNSDLPPDLPGGRLRSSNRPTRAQEAPVATNPNISAAPREDGPSEVTTPPPI